MKKVITIIAAGLVSFTVNAQGDFGHGISSGSVQKRCCHFCRRHVYVFYY